MTPNATLTLGEIEICHGKECDHLALICASVLLSCTLAYCAFGVGISSYICSRSTSKHLALIFGTILQFAILHKIEKLYSILNKGISFDILSSRNYLGELVVIADAASIFIGLLSLVVLAVRSVDEKSGAAEKITKISARLVGVLACARLAAFVFLSLL